MHQLGSTCSSSHERSRNSLHAAYMNAGALTPGMPGLAIGARPVTAGPAKLLARVLGQSAILTLLHGVSLFRQHDHETEATACAMVDRRKAF